MFLRHKIVWFDGSTFIIRIVVAGGPRSRGAQKNLYR